jgi:hypothetical protein
MDPIPLGKSLIHESPCGFLIKNENIGINISKEKANKLAINRFRATLDFHETIMALIAAMTIITPKQSKVSEISENTILRSDDPRISIIFLE